MIESESPKRLSILIPTLNEAAYLPNCLAAINRARAVAGPDACLEIVVCDGGSDDGTAEIVAATGDVRLVRSVPGRALQMNQAATAASGDLYWFLHADTQISPESLAVLLKNANSVQLGAFRFKLDVPGLRYRLLEVLVRIRTEVFGMPYGDQGIFTSRQLFERVGGYPDQRILEDVELWRRAFAFASPKLFKEPVVTSGRFWKNAGLLKTTWINARVMLAYFRKRPPEEIYEIRRRYSDASRG